MKKYLILCTLAMLFILFGCEEEYAFRLHTAPEYYQGRAILPSGQQIEMTESDRTNVLDACYPEDALSRVPNGERQLIGTVTLSRPLITTSSADVFPTATFFEVENQTYVQCEADTISYVKQIDTLPNSLIPYREQAVSSPETSNLRTAQPHEQVHFTEEMAKPVGNEPYPKRSGFEQTLVHVTMPFNGAFEFTFESPETNETIMLPIDESSRQAFLSLGLGTEVSQDAKQYGLHLSPDQTLYEDVLRPKDASFDRMLGARQANPLPTTLVPNERYPLFSFSFIRDGKPHKQVVSITYREETLLRGDQLKTKMRQQFAHRRHVVTHELALLGTESKDESFLNHANAETVQFVFQAIDRSKAVASAGTPAPTPYLTVFEGICAQTFDVSYDEDDVYLTDTFTGSHFKLLRADAERWHDLFNK
ncbi:hypothetical protein [Exiguobacterium sp. SL-9]|uniref:hypothetical protein n=1 Tax=Exiguobacterium sp. SL-9 TaxID=2510963 RepID=UPI001F2A0F2A|nr:hypothetical protein [Exiguobacterium sp. SL-9]